MNNKFWARCRTPRHRIALVALVGMTLGALVVVDPDRANAVGAVVVAIVTVAGVMTSGHQK